MHAFRHRLATLVTVPALTGLVVAATGRTRPQNTPGTGTTVAMTVTNDTDDELTLVSSTNPQGRWVEAPPVTLAPRSSAVVSVWSNDLRGVSFGVRYAVRGAEAVFSAGNRTPYGADIAGTRLEGDARGSYGISTRIDTCYPSMTLEYRLHRTSRHP